MVWEVKIADELDAELDELPREVRIEMLAVAEVLAQLGPQMGRPRVDTLKGSRYANMKELRFDAAGGVWRVAFAFDPARTAILLVAGDKSGTSERRFYRQLIAIADARYAAHLPIKPMKSIIEDRAHGTPTKRKGRKPPR